MQYYSISKKYHLKKFEKLFFSLLCFYKQVIFYLNIEVINECTKRFCLNFHKTARNNKYEWNSY